MGTWPAVVFDPRPASPAVWFYPNGLIDGDAAKPIPLDVPTLALADLFGTIDDIHARFLLTPGAQLGGAKLWKKAAQHWPVENAEQVVQLALLIGLQMAYPTCDVRVERELATGRVDIEVHTPLKGAQGPKTPDRHCMLCSRARHRTRP